MNEITSVVLTKNEEQHIADCLASLAWCAEVVVLDSYSTDRTVEIARQLGARVVQHPFMNFPIQRNYGIDLVHTEWVFFVDADERVPPELADEVQRVVLDPHKDGWWVPTRNNYFGQWLNHGGFYPDYHLRLARKHKLHYDPRQKVHEHPDAIDKAGFLANPLIHYCYQNLPDLCEAKARYAVFLAQIHFEKGVKPTYHLIAAPILTFIEQFLVKQSYRDGWVGLLISLIWSYYAFDEYRILRGLVRSQSSKVDRVEPDDC